MFKMGVKKKHETFEELNEPATKSNGIIPAEWLHCRNQSPRSIQSPQHTVNGESNYLNKQVELLDITHGINSTNSKSSYNSYLSAYNRENMSSAGESKSKHTQRSTYLNQLECNSNNTIVISDEEDDVDDGFRSHHTNNQQFDNGKHITERDWKSNFPLRL